MIVHSSCHLVNTFGGLSTVIHRQFAYFAHKRQWSFDKCSQQQIAVINLQISVETQQFREGVVASERMEVASQANFERLYASGRG
jgi:hypothetical protein